MERIAGLDGPPSGAAGSQEPPGAAVPDGVPPVAAGPPAAPLGPVAGRFTRGPVGRHVLVMTATSTVGVMAIFAVDFLSLLYVSRLGDPRLTAAVGYATQVLFYPVSINIGLTIGVGAIVARALGAGETALARRRASSGLVLGLIASALVAAGLLAAVDPLLHAIGARGELQAVAAHFLRITLPANVPLAAGMVFSGILRATGDARRAMYVTLAGGIATGIADPILIFGLHLGVTGAAISTVLARFAFVLVGYHGAVRVHGLLGRPRLAALRVDAAPLLNIALPAVATNLATPVGNSYVLHVFSAFGAAAVSATTVTDRIVPLAFAVLFALSGAVGPILAQNLGAGRIDRVRATLSTAFGLVAAYVLCTWAILRAAEPLILALFAPPPEAAGLITFFLDWGVSAWLFIGCLFVANACFNNLGFPWLSLLFNWGRATLGTIPFVTLGAHWGGIPGGQLGIAGGAALFGLGAVATAYRVTGRLARAPLPH